MTDKDILKEMKKRLDLLRDKYEDEQTFARNHEFSMEASAIEYKISAIRDVKSIIWDIEGVVK